MLSLEATSAKTLTMLSTLFQKASIRTAPLPVIPKSHDDLFLKPAKKQIGERIASAETVASLALLHKFDAARTQTWPSQTRSFSCPKLTQTFSTDAACRPALQVPALLSLLLQLHLLARSHGSSFKIENTPLGVRVFSNACVDPPQPMKEEAQHLEKTQKELPTHASLIACKDGYKADAMLFVDEDL